METPIDETTAATPADQRAQYPQDIKRASRIPRPLRQRTRSRTGLLPPRLGTGNIQHIAAVPDTYEATDDIPRSNLPRLPIHPIGKDVQCFVPDVVRSTCRRINEPVAARLNRLTEDLPVNIKTLKDLFTRFEVLESAQKSHQLDTEPTVSARSALRVEVNDIIERISTHVTDAQQKSTVRKLNQDTPNANQQLPLEQPARNTPVRQRFIPINPDQPAHILPSTRKDQPLSLSNATIIANPSSQNVEYPKPNPRDFSVLLTDRMDTNDDHRQTPRSSLLANHARRTHLRPTT